jgi:hypothetical protein
LEYVKENSETPRRSEDVFGIFSSASLNDDRQAFWNESAKIRETPLTIKLKTTLTSRMLFQLGTSYFQFGKIMDQGGGERRAV